MSALGLARGDGIGIEVTHDLLRGVRLDAAEPQRVVAAAEVSIAARHDDRTVLDALIRLRADLGDHRVPTRVAMFPPGSTLTRLDATGSDARELNVRRAEIAASRNASSSILVDDGPRRWLVGVAWDDAEVRRMEELAERAGFVDVAVDPSPLALARVLDERATFVRRNAATDECFAAVAAGGVVVAAATLDSIGRTVPGLTCSDVAVSTGWFDGVDDPSDLAIEIRRLLDDAPPVDCPLQLTGVRYPEFPAHDLRAPQRQCVALGAAIGAAGLAGRLRPVDMQMPTNVDSDGGDRPWAIERVSDLPAADTPATIGRTKRAVSRMLPRRR